MNNDLISIISTLLDELASEVDLHYEEEDLPKVSETIEHMRQAASALEQAGVSPPDAYRHIVARFLRAHH